MNRAARAKEAAKFRASKKAERLYVKDLRGIMQRVHTGYLKALAPKLRHDGISTYGQALDGADSLLVRYVRHQTGQAFDRMSATVKKKHANPLPVQLIGIHPEAAMLPVIATFRDANIALMEKAGRTYAAQVREVIDENYGLRAEDLAPLLQERASVSESRAELIARDQTLKLNGQINAAKQQGAGVTQYIWSTSADERVRPDHADLDGETFTWGDPPITDQSTGARNEPGQDFQCRCVPLPVIEEFDGI